MRHFFYSSAGEVSAGDFEMMLVNLELDVRNATLEKPRQAPAICALDRTRYCLMPLARIQRLLVKVSTDEIMLWTMVDGMWMRDATTELKESSLGTGARLRCIKREIRKNENGDSK